MKINRTILFVLILLFVLTAACTIFFFKSSGCGLDKGFITGVQTITSNEVEREYYLKLPENYDFNNSYPLIFAFHGFTSDYTVFSESEYDLQEAVGDEAILVYPNAMKVKGETLWNTENESDLNFLDDLFDELEANLCFDKRRVFATGHSNGAVFTNMLGCRRGDVLRAIAPVSGIFLEDYDEEACVGQVASITMHGDNDTTIPKNSALAGLEYWVSINSCSSETDNASQGFGFDCEVYEGCDLKYPVSYCEFSGGHIWPDSAGEIIWDFFNNLPSAIPSSFPGFGKAPETKGIANIKIEFPSDMIGVPYMISLGLYPSGSTTSLSGSPDKMLTLPGFPVGAFTLGEEKEYNDIDVNLGGVEDGDYALVALVYVEGGLFPIPLSGKDYIGVQEITLADVTINIETPFELELMIY